VMYSPMHIMFIFVSFLVHCILRVQVNAHDFCCIHVFLYPTI